MALYNNGYPNTYQQYYQQNQMQQQSPQIQNGGIVSVPSIEYARNFIVMPGTTVTFIDENAPYVYTKTRKSQFDQPVFEKLRLVREEDTPHNEGPSRPVNNYALNSDLEILKEEVEKVKKEMDSLSKELGVKDE